MTNPIRRPFLQTLQPEEDNISENEQPSSSNNPLTDSSSSARGARWNTQTRETSLGLVPISSQDNAELPENMDGSSILGSVGPISSVVLGPPPTSSDLIDPDSQVTHSIFSTQNPDNERPFSRSIGVFFINGGCSSEQQAESTAVHLSDLFFDHPVNLFYYDRAAGATNLFQFICPGLPARENFFLRYLLSCIDRFFSNQSSSARLLLIGEGNASCMIQAALNATPWASQITVILVNPRTYISPNTQGTEVHHLRSSWDLTSSLDISGHSSARESGRLRTLPHTTDSASIFMTQLTDAAFSTALREIFLRALSTSDSELYDGIPHQQETTCSEQRHSMALVVPIHEGTLSLVLQQQAGRTYSDWGANLVLSANEDSFIYLMGLLARVIDTMLMVLILPLVPEPDVFVSYAIISGYSIAFVGDTFILSTNSPRLSRRFRRSRILARTILASTPWILCLDAINMIRRSTQNIPSCLRILFIWIGSHLSILAFYNTAYPYLPVIRNRVETRLLRALGAPEHFDHRQENALERRNVLQIAQILMNLFIYGVVISSLDIGTGFLATPLHLQCRIEAACPDNNTGAYNELKNSTICNRSQNDSITLSSIFEGLGQNGAREDFVTGRMKSVAQTFNFFWSCLMMCMYIFFIIKMISNHRRHLRPQ